MNDLLNDINAVAGVLGVCVCDDDGKVIASTLPQAFDAPMMGAVGRIFNKTLDALKVARRRKVNEMDLTFDTGRLVVKNLTKGCMVIVCTPSINVPLLNLTANVVARKLQETTQGDRAGPPSPPRPSKVERMREAIVAELGDHASRAIEILVLAGDDPVSLGRAADEIEALTRTFIDRRKAGALAVQLRAIVTE